MRKYLSKLLFFAFILLIVLTTVDCICSSLMRKSNYRPVQAWEDIIEGGIHADVVASGSSRVWVHIDPDILDTVLRVNTYNLGMDGSSINRQVQKYSIFRKYNSKPRVIIQNIDAWSLGYSIGYQKEQFFPYFWNKEMRATFFPTEPFSFAEKYIPFYRYHGMNSKWLIPTAPSLHKGYQGQIADWNGEAYRQQGKIEFSVSDTTLCMFHDFLGQTKEEGIKVVFVYAPLFYGAKQKITNIDEMYRLYQDLADQYEIPIIDLSDMWICRDTAFFYNAMHLNKEGAEIYSDSLANGIKRLNLL